MDPTLEEILNIDKDNDFLKYIVRRVQREDYRGIHRSQHNRYDREKVAIMLSAIHDVVGENHFPIPLGDFTLESARSRAERKAPDYVKIVRKIKDKIGRTTINSLKKNFFVDFHRAGFIDRLDKQGNLLDPYGRLPVHKARLTKKGIELIKTSDIADRYYLFSRGIDELLRGFVFDLLDTLYYSDYRDVTISFKEFQYIFSDTDALRKRSIDLLNRYRALKSHSKDQLDKLLQRYCDPNNFPGHKTTKRDYHNWRNETQQIMLLLKNTMYFDVSKDCFSLYKGEYSVFPDKTRKKRKMGIKQEYFDKHKVHKRDDFNLHHIVPIKYARNKKEWMVIDDYKNLIYIDENTHKLI